jgi:FkbM family methyltransferase
VSNITRYRLARRLYGAIVPVRTRSALWRFRLRRRIRGKLLPFVVAAPQSQRTLNCCVAYNKYGAYCVPVSALHRPAPLSVCAGEVWEAETIALMVAHCAAGDIVHAGAFFGDFLPALAAACAPASRKIWAFEPNPESYRCAAVTLLLNQIGNVELINAGLGEQPSAGRLVTSEGGQSLGGGAYILPGPSNLGNGLPAGTTPVRIVAIDDIVPEHRTVSVIQLDVEGYEERALAGAMRTIRRNRPLLILETLPTERWISENLLPLGYHVAESIPDNFVVRADRAATVV